MGCWDWGQNMMIQFHEHRGPVTAVLPDNMNDQICHSCSTDGTIMSYDVRKGRRIATHNMARRGKFVDMDQRLDSETELITVTTTGQVHCWDIDEDNCVQEHEDAREYLTCVALSRSGTLLAVGSDSSFVKVYHMPSTASGELSLVAVGQGHFSTVTDLQWSPDEKQLVSVSDNCSMCVWNFYGIRSSLDNWRLHSWTPILICRPGYPRTTCGRTFCSFCFQKSHSFCTKNHRDHNNSFCVIS